MITKPLPLQRRDILKYLEAFPYRHGYFPHNADVLFYLKEVRSQHRLHLLDLGRSRDLGEGRQVSPEDFSKRCFEPRAYHPERRTMYLVSDEANRENFNVYALDLATGRLQRLTRSSYCLFSGVSPDFRYLCYGDRYKIAKGLFHTRLYLRDLGTGRTRRILSDDGWEYRFTWGEPVFSPDRKQVILSVDRQNQRKKCNLVLVDLETGRHRKLLEKRQETSGVGICGMEFDGRGFFYISDRDGFDNFYRYSLATGQSRQLTRFRQRNQGMRLQQWPEGDWLIAVHPRPEKDDTLVTGRRVSAEGRGLSPFLVLARLKGSWYLSGNRRQLWLSSDGLDRPPFQRKFTLAGRRLRRGATIRRYLGPSSTLVHNTYRFLQYRSFDGLRIPAYLSLPQKPLRGAVITAFYGGENGYDYEEQILHEMGLACFSPAVRGSWGWGKAWEDRLKGDLGGNEILDVVWAARFLERELRLPPQRIGVSGGSHGGYSVLRALTLPEGFRGRPSKYPFGFGLCWAGFADLEDFYRTSNCFDWLVDLLGPYDRNRAKYRDRSPLHHFQELQAPLMVVHGTNDRRVHPSSMAGFLDKLERSRIFHVIHWIKGQGHTPGSRREKLELLWKKAAFLERVLSREE